MPGDDAKRPFRTYRGRGDDAEDPIEERARAGAAAEAAPRGAGGPGVAVHTIRDAC